MQNEYFILDIQKEFLISKINISNIQKKRLFWISKIIILDRLSEIVILDI